MLTEEALVLLATLVASGLLVLGILELVSPSRPRHVRRGRGPQPHRETSPLSGAPTAVLDDPAPAEPDIASTAVEPRPVVEQPVVATAIQEPLPGIVAEVAPGAPEIATEPPTTVIAVSGEPVPETVEAATEPGSQAAGAGDPALVLEQCRELARQERFAEVVSSADVALREPGLADRTTAAALWREVAGARIALADREGALAAFGNAIDVAPDAERDAIRAALVGWAVESARTTVDGAGEDGRFEALRAARTLLDEAAASAGADPAIAAARAALEPEYWPAYEAHVRSLIAERDFGEAYRVATEALSDEGLPPQRRAAFEEFRTETLTARIVGLVERAIVAMAEHREWEAVGALERAETLLRSATTLSAERRDETARRLAEGYAQLGRRRVDGGEFEDALDPLFRALRIGPAPAADRDDTRWAMVQALQGVVEARVAMIREVAATGHRESAVVQAEKLWALLRSGIAAGVPQESMMPAVTTTRQVLEDLGASGAR